jgi:sugar phosphate isomerase/epimerase
VITRRELLQSSVGAIALVSAHKLMGSPKQQPLGVQLWTVRDQVDKELPTVLKTLHEIGYEEVETFGSMYNRPAAELKKMCSDNGLRATAGHFEYNGIEKMFDYAQEVGMKYVINPSLPEEMTTTLDGYKKAADQYNRWGEQLNKRGMRFGYHNHNAEFKKMGGSTGFDTLMSSTDPKLVWFEVDCFWAKHAGRDPVAMIKEHGDRIRLLHIKDRKPGTPTSTEQGGDDDQTEIGTGEFDWKTLFAAASSAGVEHYYVEQDKCARPPLESVRISYNNLRKILG